MVNMPGKTGDHIVTRFLRLIQPGDVERNKCWNWIGCIQSNGYGRFNFNGNIIGAHRASYLLFCGKQDQDLDVCHTCDNRRCVRPDHLFLGTRKDNMEDAKKKGRLSTGESHSDAIRRSRSNSCKLTPDQVLVINERLNSGHRPSVIARDYGVICQTISGIKRGHTWAHLTGRKQDA